MILVNNSNRESKWTVTPTGAPPLGGIFKAGQYHRIDNPPGYPPYTVGFTCSGIEGVQSKDAVVTFDTGKPAQASYPD
ncbi:MAG: hypothetical protein WAM82_29115 [Thermoanaerobaculia bacterium]